MELKNEAKVKINEDDGGMPTLYTVSEVAKYLHVSNSTVYRLIREGTLAGIKIGQSLRFTRQNIEDMIASSAKYTGI